jgi:hypothetical protein
VGYFGFGTTLGFFILKGAKFEMWTSKHKFMKVAIIFNSLMAGLFYISYGVYGMLAGQQTIYTTIGLLGSSGVWALSTVPMGCALVQEHTPKINEAISVGINFWLAQSTSVLIIYLAQQCTP